MRKRPYLWALLALLLPLAAQAQQTLTVADSTASSAVVPFDGFNADAAQHNQMIYPASMLNTMSGSTITMLQFYIDPSGSNGSNTAAARLGTWTVSLGETSATTLATLDNSTPLTEVYEGYFDCSTSTLTILFETPYYYNGGNLLVDLNHAAASWNRWYFLGIESTGSAFTYGDVRNFLPKATFTYSTGTVDFCYRPQNVQVTGVIDTAATLLWVDTLNTGASYTVQLISGTDTTPYTSATSPLSFTGLTANTPYTVRIASDCGSGTSLWESRSFRTTCASMAIPYSIDFESAPTLNAPPCWMLLGGSANVTANTSYSPYSHNGSNYLKFSGSLRNMVALPPMQNDINTLQVRFWTRPESTSNASCGTFEVGYITNLADTTTFVPLASYLYSDFSDYEEMEVILAGAPSGAYIALLHKALSSSWYWYVDDLVVEPIPACARPSSVTVSDITSSSATLNIADPNGINHYLVALNGDSATVSGNTLELDTLAPNTTYTVYVSTLCTDGTTTPSLSVSFTTLCDAMSIPYATGFESETASSAPSCWTTMDGSANVTSNPAYTSTSYSHEGSNYLQFRGSSRNMVALPTMEEDINTLQVRFWTRPDSYTNSNSGSFEVGYITDLTDTTTFVPLASYLYSEFASYEEKEVSMATAPSGAFIALLHKAGNNYWNWYVDDLVVEPIPACARPQGTHAYNITGTSATLHIEDTNQVNNYQVILITGNDTTILTASDTVAYLSSLLPATGYRVMVGTICDDGSVSNTTNTAFFTGCALIETFPYTENFDSWATGSTGVPHCWNRLFDNSFSIDYNSFPYATNSVSRSASNSFWMYSLYDEYDDYGYIVQDYLYSVAYMPEFSVPLQGLTMSFWYKAVPAMTSYINHMSLAVGVSVNTNDTATFTRLLTIHPNDTAWHEYELDFSAYAGTGTRITFLQFKDGGNYEEDNGYIDDITVDQIGTCARPATVTASNVDSTTALITWTDPNGTGNYSVRWTENDSTFIYGDLFINLSGLTSSTFYTVTVRRICDDGTLTDARQVTFQTSSTPVATLPYSTGFEATDDNGWDFVNATVNRWAVGSATANGGNRSLYISTDNGTTNAYNTGSAGVSFASRTLALGEGSYALTFDWKGYGESNYDFLCVYFCPDSLVLNPALIPTNSSYSSSLTPAGWQDVVGGKLNESNSWQSASGTFTVTDAGLYKVVFMWRNDNSTGNNPPAAIDNVLIQALDCPAPTALTFDSISDTKAVISWTAGGSESSWAVSVDGGDWQTVSTPTYTITGLAPVSSHTVAVRALCSATDTSLALNGSFTTNCATIGTLPWMETFDAISQLSDLTCWDRYSGLYSATAPTVLVPSTSGMARTTAALGGSPHVRINITGNYCRWLVTPTIAISAPARLNFDYALTNYGNNGPINPAADVADDRFMVLVSADGGNSWSPLATWAGSDYASIPHTGTAADLSLDDYIGQNIRIAFYGESTAPGGDNNLHLDNVAVVLDTNTYYIVRLASADTAMGSVSPADSTVVIENNTFTATATASRGYRFVSWVDAAGATVSTDNPYTFTVTANTALTAIFEPLDTTFTVSAVFDEEQGTVLGAGSYNAGTQVTLTAVPNEGFRFVAWMDGTTEVSTANPYRFTVTDDVTLSAIFAVDSTEPDRYVVTVHYDATRGTVLGAGTYVAGTQVTLTATSNPGYRFAGWSNGVEDSTYIFVIQESVTLTANFEEIVGIDDVDANALGLYPNPARTTVTVNGLESGSTVTVVDLNGREVLSTTEPTIDVSSLAPGAYFVRITGQRQNAIRKLIVK